MKLFLILITSLSTGISWGQCKKVNIEVKYTDSSVVKADTLLMYVVSNTPSRIFLDKLYVSLKDILIKRNIFLKYSYEGRRIGVERLNEITKSNSPNLFIVDEEPSTISVIGKHSNVSGGSSNIPDFNFAYKRAHIAYSNIYSVIVFGREQNIQFYAEMKVDCKDLSKTNSGDKAGKFLANKLNMIYKAHEINELNN